MTEETIKTLLAEKGLKYDETGEAIASYNRSIVFLPKGPVPSQKVRVIIKEIPGKTDRCGRPMYEGAPAPVEYAERWKDNGDGTASRVKIACDWLLQESEVEVIETRELTTRGGTPRSVRPEFRIVWGGDLASTQIEKKERQSVPLEGEQVENGSLVWVKTNSRDEEIGTKLFPALRLEPIGRGGSVDRFLELSYDSAMEAGPGVYYQEGNSELYLSEQMTWLILPGWIQTEVLARFPICSCGRKRRDTEVTSFDRCSLCHAEQKCERCGKQLPVKYIGSRLVCVYCEPYEIAEQLIAAHLTDAHRQAIAEEAKKLLAGQALVKDEGETVLRATVVGHVNSSWTEGQILRKWCAHEWYYFCEDGVYGTQFSPAAISLLEYLPEASGNGLVELVAWLTWVKDRSAGGRTNFYLYTQLRNEQVEPLIDEEDLKELVDKLEVDQPVLAEWLRGSEEERLAAWEAFRQAQKDFQNAPWRPFGNLLDDAKEALRGEEQDYALALEKIQQAYAEKAKRQVLEDLLAQEYSRCPLCGEEVDWTDSHYCREQEALRAKGQYRDFEVKVSQVGEAALVRLVAVYGSRYDDYELRREVDDSVVISDPDAVETETYWREPSAREREIAEEIADLRRQLDAINQEISYGNRVIYKLMDDTDRLSKELREQGVRQLRSTGKFSGSVEFRDARDGETWRQYDNIDAIFSCRVYPNSEHQPQPSETWILIVKFQITQTVEGVPVLAANPRARDDRETLKAEIARFEAELAAEAAKVDAFDEDGEPQTAMAAALKKAGIV